MNQFIIGNPKTDNWIEATIQEINRLLSKKEIEQMVVIDEHTIEINLSTKKTIIFKKQDNDWVIILKDKE